MKKQNKRMKKIISFALLTILVMANFIPSFATSKTIYIDSIEDFIAFSKDASLDTYFKNKAVLLRTDIDLSHTNDFQIPTFAGIFDGQGHTISGINLSKSGSVQGLFRYLQEDALIKNLHLSGNITPSGSQNIIGSLVGNNKGSIEHCHFNGTVLGEDNIGGLVGINEATGNISHSSSSGMVTGVHYTGGIVGQNLGTIFKSTNYCQVNTTISETTVNIESIDWSQINSMENIKAHTDTGGITGLSSGYIQDCVNRGPVGYKYMGYNVGGIVGRQSGSLSNCQNYHTVLGRKDVGGIVGQIEPHLILLFSEDTLQKLNQELSVLDGLFNNTLSHAKSSSESISSNLTTIGESLDDTWDILEILSSDTVDYVDDVAETVNITSRRIRYTLEEIIPILEDGEELSKSLNHGLNYLDDGFNNLEITSGKMADALDESQEAMKNLRKAIASGQDALYQTNHTLKRLLNQLENGGDINNLTMQLEKGMGSLGESFRDASNALNDIYDAFKYADDIDPGFSHPILEFLPGLNELAQALNSISSAISEAARALNRDLDYIYDDLQELSKNLGESVKYLQYTFSKLEDTATQSGKAFDNFSHGFNSFGDAAESLTTMTVSIRGLIDSLVAQPTIELPNVTSEYRQSGDDLFRTIRDISSEVKNLSGEMKNARTTFTSDIERINDQVFTIFHLLTESREELNEPGYMEDISGESLDDAELGVVYKNENYGFVSGAVNIGGIAGASYAKIDHSFALSSLSGKDYIGGIAGYGSHISNSYTLVDIIKATEWIGAIAGKAEGEISNNYYVHETLAAIDGISYSEKASPLTYTELLEVESLPDPFTKFYLTFIVDGDIIEKIPFEYGDSFDLSLLPVVPDKEGHDKHWEEFDPDHMTFNTTIEAIYTPLKTVISSNFVRSEEELPLVLAEGSFRNNVTLKVSPFDIPSGSFPGKYQKTLESWDIALEGLEDSHTPTTLRLLLPETKKKVTIWQSTNTGWEKLDSSINGRYIVFPMEKTSGTFCISERSFPWMIFIIIAMILIVTIAIFFIIFYFYHPLHTSTQEE